MINVFEPGDGLLTSIENQVLAGHQIRHGLRTVQHEPMLTVSMGGFMGRISVHYL